MFHWLKSKYVAYQYTWGFCYKELMVESSFTFVADNFLTFSAGNGFWDLWRHRSRCLLIAEIGVCLVAADLFLLFVK
jgi:hypothetical protein